MIDEAIGVDDITRDHVQSDRKTDNKAPVVKGRAQEISHFKGLRNSQKSERQTKKDGKQRPEEESFMKDLVVSRV